MHEARRLPPDTRFLEAVGDVRSMVAGTPSGPAQARRQADGWAILLDGRQLATVPDNPSFGQLLGVLHRWVAQVASAAGVSPAPVEPAGDRSAQSLAADPQSLFGTLSVVDAAATGGRRSAAAMGRAARALATLSFEIPAEGPSGDDVMARALAALAVAQELGRVPLRHSEILLSHVMGYGAHAAALAAQLPQDDPVRLYMDRHADHLERAALRTGSPGLTPLLALRLAAEQHEMESFQRIAGRCFGHSDGALLPVVVAGLRLHQFSTDLEMGQATIGTLLHDLDALGKDRPAREAVDTIRHILQVAGMHRAAALIQRPAPANVFERFHAGLASLDLPADGGYHGRALVTAFYRDCLDGAIAAMARFFLDSYSSAPGARALADALAPANAAQPDPVVLWLRHAAAAKAGTIELTVLLDDLRTLHGLSPGMRERLMADFLHLAPYGSPKLLEAGQAMLAGLDSRPQARLTLGWIAGPALSDLNLAETSYASGVKETGRRTLWPMVRYAWWMEDAATLHEVAEDPASPPWAALAAARSLHKIGADDTAGTISLLRKLAVRHPSHLNTTLALVDALEGAGRLREAEKILRRWLRANPDPDLARVEATVHLCEVLRKRGHVRQALREIEPAAQSWKRSALVMQAELLDAAGRPEDAEKVARQAVERYPDVMDALREEVALLWRHGRLDRAASLLAHPPHPIGATQWRWTLGPEFAREFGDDPKMGIEAAEAMIRAGVPPLPLEAMADQVHQEGSPQLAFEIVSRLHPAQPLYRVQLAVEGYHHLKAARGRGPALAWLKGQVPGALLNALSQFAFQERDLELLWDPVPAEPAGFGADWVWLFRAAAVTMEPKTFGAHRAGLMRYLGDAPKTRETAITGHLLGVLPARELIPLAHEPKELCETAYYLGLRAQYSGHVREAAGWYALAIQLGRPGWAERRWAFQQVSTWYNTGRSLDRLTAESGRVPRAGHARGR